MAEPKYTTYSRLSRRLRGRLNLGAEFPEENQVTNTLSALVAYQPAATEQNVDLMLIDEIAEQEESFIELVLSQLYRIPFQLTSEVTVNILGSISESFILAGVLSVHFQGQGGSSIIATDVSQAMTDWRRFGEMRLQMLVAGENIWFPSSLQAPIHQPNTTQAQALVLPGEIKLANKPDVISRNYTFENKRNISPKNKFFDNNGSPCDGRRDGTAAGSDPSSYNIDCNNYTGYQIFDF